ncbi:putative sel1-like repeat-containing protein [Acanthamoeba castellanii mimivirus]|jgi:hypothetical protein|uniref:Putative sel1-like repeat-containing protein R815 n=5 Tax=Mimivirus TaxID=315393 RepID=YR815_MIMIV|nr:putative sel1-like repeat-containing protein [Acanthamoeba polyphaga mimivirus]Q5UQH0.1 RecName: Full=Putative sel1-like repeat-containing protein R815 [Acanthamoeba polyphaga mimivirus]AEQ61030.1 TPR repeat protein, SEL1 subfamily [Acanthamoeba castellanii mamavirus]AHA45013.1 putative sel1-like repeat-containing protein [Hirudovirus strain Sangsue]ALR84463.1 TPR repeat protein [Niemeyer virus]AMK62055.1 sel1-like repeat-containing protein [Samba virus]AMZ03257.1 putative sel1-like repeat
MENLCDKCSSVIYSKEYHQCLANSTTRNFIVCNSTTINYDSLTMKQLCELANGGNKQVQKIILDRIQFFSYGSVPHRYIEFKKWEYFMDKIPHNQNYVRLYLCWIYYNCMEIDGSIIAHIKNLAKMCNIDAQTNYGLVNEYGIGVKKNIKKAIKWYKLSCYKENLFGLLFLGSLYERGYGVSCDKHMAFNLYEKATKHNYPAVKRQLAFMYRTGSGTTKNINKSHELYREAANQGYPLAQYALALQCKYGHGCIKNYKEAETWLIRSYNNGCLYATYSLARLYIETKSPLRNYSRAFELMQEAASENYLLAINYLAKIYKNGIGVNKNISRAIYWYYKAGNSTKITELLEINNSVIINTLDCNIFTCLDSIENEILFDIQLYILKYKYGDKCDYNLQLYQQLETIVFECIKLRNALDKSSALTTCLKPITKEYRDELSKFTIDTDVFVKHYYFNKQTYMTFGKANVKLSDDIIFFLSKKPYINIVNKLICLNKTNIDTVKDIKSINSKLQKYANLFVRYIEETVNIRNTMFQIKFSFIFR